VASFISDTLAPITLTDVQNKYKSKGIECTIDLINGSRRADKFVVLGVYRPPNSAAGWFDIFTELILELLPIGQPLLLGDFNCDLLKPHLPATRKLMDILALTGVEIIENLPTRISDTTATSIDLIGLPITVDCQYYQLGTLAVSDHFPVEACFTMAALPKLMPIVKRSFRTVDFNNLNQRVKNIQLEDTSTPTANKLLTQ
jgi:hypothetical protein